jgi:2,3-bisphosphoglycerate-independent phosphoglycerate mutase
MVKKTMLIILDGWGIGPDPSRSAIFLAQTPVMNNLTAVYPNSTLTTFGEDVGLPEGQMGNSEVGHINIGAGRIIYQDLARINKAVKDKTLHDEPLLKDAIHEAVKRNASIHLLGLVSDGGVHSHINHLLALCDISKAAQAKNVFIHAFTDGRDTDPKSGLNFIQQVQDHIMHSPCKLATIIGRYYAMDRDNRWERTKLAYDLLVHGSGKLAADPLKEIQDHYNNNVTDEFLPPMKFIDVEAAKIKDEDLVIFYNFRTDRPRQLTTVLTQEAIAEQNLYPLDIDMITFTRYDENYEGIDVIFDKESISHSLGEVISDNGLKQLRIAETEKYPHVTFFFSGGREHVFPHEHRILIPSPKVATYDLAPEMSAESITDALIDHTKKEMPDFVCLNFANTDMVGHTGDLQAAVYATETVDRCLGKIIESCLPLGYAFLIIADHGNSDYMINDDGTPNTAHTTNPVPIIYVAEDIDKSNTTISKGKLADIAPTILHIMGLDKPAQMTGLNLVNQ